MTTIAYDGNILAADTQVTCQNSWVAGFANKIHKLSDGSYIAFAGNMNALPSIVDYFETGKEPELKDVQFELLHIDSTGIAHDYYNDMQKGFAVIPWVGGSGAQIALSALHMGKNAIEAVELACKLDIRTGGDVNHVTIK
jgi:hypothetical protein